MSKYIINIPDSVKKIVYFHVGNANAIWTTSNILDDLEELNSDYINEHFGQLQDDAYQRGLDDAWEAARKIADMWTRIDNDELLAIFGITERIGHSAIRSLFGKQTVNEAMLELEAYEEKQKAENEIKVGDEVIYIEHKFIVFATETEEHYASLFDVNGRHASASQSKCKKTGRHFDIDKILEEMKE